MSNSSPNKDKVINYKINNTKYKGILKEISSKKLSFITVRPPGVNFNLGDKLEIELKKGGETEDKQFLPVRISEIKDLNPTRIILVVEPIESSNLRESQLNIQFQADESLDEEMVDLLTSEDLHKYLRELKVGKEETLPGIPGSIIKDVISTQRNPTEDYYSEIELSELNKSLMNKNKEEEKFIPTEALHNSNHLVPEEVDDLFELLEWNLEEKEKGETLERIGTTNSKEMNSTLNETKEVKYRLRAKEETSQQKATEQLTDTPKIMESLEAPGTYMYIDPELKRKIKERKKKR